MLNILVLEVRYGLDGESLDFVGRSGVWGVYMEGIFRQTHPTIPWIRMRRI